MAESWTKVELNMPTKKDYDVVEFLIKEFFDDREYWLVEKYDEANLEISFEDNLALYEEGKDFALALNGIVGIFENKYNEITGKEFGNISFSMHIYSYEYGECHFIIERQHKKLTIRENCYDIRYKIDYDDYDEFCEINVHNDDMKKMISEDAFNNASELYLKNNRIYIDEIPEYDEPMPFNKTHLFLTKKEFDEINNRYLKNNYPQYVTDNTTDSSTNAITKIMYETVKKYISEYPDSQPTDSMLLHDTLVKALEYYNISGVRIFCDEAIREDVAQFFTDKFTEEWNKALDFVEQENGDCATKDEDIYPAAINITDCGVFVNISNLTIEYAEKSRAELDCGIEALDKTLEAIKEYNSTVSYDGWIAYVWSDMHGGGVIQYEVSSEDIVEENNKIYNFIGDILSRIFSQEDDEYGENFWGYMESEAGYEIEDSESFGELVDNLYVYKKWIGDENLKQGLERIVDLICEEDEDLRPELEEILQEKEAQYE